MAHSSDLLWNDIWRIAERNARTIIQSILLGEEAYQDLLEAYQNAGGTDQLFADQLFAASPASAEQVAQVSDAKATMLAINDLYLALTNNALTAVDRLALMRRLA